MPLSLARIIVARRRLVLVVAITLAALAGAFGGSVAKNLSNGGFDDPHAESTAAKDLIEQRFGAGSPNLVLLVTAADGSVDSAASAAAGLALTEELSAELGVEGVASYWSLQASPLKSSSGAEALVLARISGGEDTVRTRIEELSPRFTRANPSATLQVEVTGQAKCSDRWEPQSRGT